MCGDGAKMRLTWVFMLILESHLDNCVVTTWDGANSFCHVCDELNQAQDAD